MDKYITISTTHPALYGLLKSDLPEGVRIISEAPMERRSFDWNITISFDIKFTIDLTYIAAVAFAIWLSKHIRRPKREIETKINGKQIPIDQSEAIEFIAKEIEHEQNEQNNKN
jgi:hypothetical protein